MYVATVQGCGLAGQHIDALADDRVDQDGGVTATPAQGDIVHVEHSGTPALG
ncbi:hypothetical protein Sar04_49100 [Salinispora arenicola]|uniref:Uncharacterized protein n=1 Tax=Salinispora arenicola TaxID=168697 RepID=A0ABQ4JZ28_SALAC|nr:hypothetical protein Sar04_49100 [Salinispora arenicola]